MEPDFTWHSDILRDQAVEHLLHQMNYMAAWTNTPKSLM